MFFHVDAQDLVAWRKVCKHIIMFTHAYDHIQSKPISFLRIRDKDRGRDFLLVFIFQVQEKLIGPLHPNCIELT